jgi:GrpB-like predicted nucleotidyltransferase (UPF0157 family)
LTGAAGALRRELPADFTDAAQEACARKGHFRSVDNIFGQEHPMDEIDIVPYNQGWPALYEAERARLLPVLDIYGLIEIAHIGSTAVPGLPAKPVIDIAITGVSLEAVREHGIEALDSLGYLFWAENPDPDDLFFVRGLPPRAIHRTHHLHITLPGSRFDERVQFRNRLRGDAGLAQRYANLKQELVARFSSDREAYTQAKTGFIAEALNRS